MARTHKTSEQNEQGFLLIGILVVLAIMAYFYFARTDSGQSRIEQSKEQGVQAVDRAKEIKDKLENRNNLDALQ